MKKHNLKRKFKQEKKGSTTLENIENDWLRVRPRPDGICDGWQMSDVLLCYQLFVAIIVDDACNVCKIWCERVSNLISMTP